MHGWVTGAHVELTRIHLTDVGKERRSSDPVPADQLRQVSKENIVRHMVQRVALHEVTCERGCVERLMGDQVLG
ncbi:MAG TPA: hypothetical protein VFT97_05265 [Candidatus Eisenbacteria bacterium]|nr:hypothetical protein [Candidatus Eisenbacteria bacterium]